MIDVPEALRQRVRQRIAELLAAIFVVFPECQMDRIGRTLFDHIAARRVFLRFDTHARRKIVKVAADIGVRRIPRCPSHPTDEKRREGGRTKGGVCYGSFFRCTNGFCDIFCLSICHMHDAATLERCIICLVCCHWLTKIHLYRDRCIWFNSLTIVCEIDVIDSSFRRKSIVF